MADDTRDKSQDSNVAQTVAASSEAPKKLRKGIVLGPDGKPCRTCNSLADMTSSARKLKAPNNSPFTTPPPRRDCPPDITVLGRSSWTLLHSLTAAYPVSPTPSQKSDITQFMGLFGKLYPCWTCAEDFQEYMKENRVRVDSREEFGRWMCEAHNDVNRKIGKQVFDCGRWEERWRTGWREGGCD